MGENGTPQVRITDSTMLLRQIHPNWRSKSIKDTGRVTSQAFKPTKKDRGKVSTDHGDLVTPANSYRKYTELGLLSIGVYGVTGAECSSLRLPVWFDPREPERPHHTSIDLTDKSRGISKKLLGLATKRGWLHYSDKEAMIIQTEEPRLSVVTMRSWENGVITVGTLVARVFCIEGTIQVDANSGDMLHVVEGKSHQFGVDELLGAAEKPPDGLKITLIS